MPTFRVKEEGKEDVVVQAKSGPHAVKYVQGERFSAEVMSAKEITDHVLAKGCIVDAMNGDGSAA